MPTGSSAIAYDGAVNSGHGSITISAAPLLVAPPLSGANFVNVPAASLTGSVPAASLTSVPAASLTGVVAGANLPALTSSASGTNRTVTLGTGNSTTFSVGASDNLGNHTATQNLSLTTAYDLLLKDTNHGLGWYGTGKTWNGLATDGPVLYGYDNGILGISRGATRFPVLYWNYLGRVGIGTTAPGACLTVQPSSDAEVGLRVSDGTTTGNIVVQPLTGGNSGYAFIGFNGAYDGGEVRYNTAKNRWRLGTDQRSTTDAFFLDTYNGTAGATVITALTNGNVGIGTPTPGQRLDVAGNVNIVSGSAQQLTIISTSTDPTGVLALTIPSTNSVCPTCSEYVLFNKAGTGTIGNISANLSGNAVLYNTASDRRLKEHIRPTHYGLADLLKIEVKDYNFIGSAAAHRTTGFLAQDLFRIYPEAVKEGDGGPTVTHAWAVDYGKLTPLLVQAIQDQHALIESQRAGIAALKAQHATQGQRLDGQQAALQTLQEQMARLMGEAPPATQARK